MANTSLCNDTSEAIELCEEYSLYLKPQAKINICCQLPPLKTPGKTISNWEVMEKVKNMIKPDTFLSIKIVKSTMEFIRLEGEIENKSKLSLLIVKLDGKTIKLSGFPESLKVRAAEAKIPFPVRHDWDSYFRDARNMNEMRPGERPDTIYLQDLPTRWFSKRSEKDGGSGESRKLRPSEEVVRKVFETFGEVRYVDIPMLDPYRKEIMGVLSKPGMIQTFYYGQDIQFECYVQFMEYIGFVKAMDAMRGMKLMYQEDKEKAHTASIKVDFDKTRHLSDRMISKRRGEKERLEALEALRREDERIAREDEERRKEEERLRKFEEEKERVRLKAEKKRLKAERRKERIDKRKQKHIEKKQREEEARMRHKIALEERRLLIATRKLESLRLLSEVFELVKEDKIKEEVARREAELEEQRNQKLMAEQRRRLEEEKRKTEQELQKKLQLRQQEQQLREKLVKNFREKEQREKEKQMEELRNKLAGNVRLKSAVVMKNSTPDKGPSRETTPMKETDRVDDTKETDDEDKDEKDDNEDPKGDDDVPSSSPVKDVKLKDKKNYNDDDVEILENLPEKDISIIEISSDEGDGKPVVKKKKPSPPPTLKSKSTLDRVLKSNRLRAWGAASRHPDDGDRPTHTTIHTTSIHPQRGIQVQVRYIDNSATTAAGRNRERDAPYRKRERTRDADRKREGREGDRRRKKEKSDTDSDDSTTTVIPPPRSAFAPPDDPVNFMPVPHPWWGPYPFPPWGPPPPPSPPPPPFRHPPWGRGGQPPRRDHPPPQGGRNFHSFKESYLKKYNTVSGSGGSSDRRGPARRDSKEESSSSSSPEPSPRKPGPKSVASSVSHSSSQKVSKKKGGEKEDGERKTRRRDVDGRYMYPLS